MKLYHASKIKGITELDPTKSTDGKLWFSSKRENVLVYLANAVEKCWLEHGNPPKELYSKWAPYGFTEDGKLRFEEYYPDALERVYKGESGYIYAIDIDENDVTCSPIIKNAYIMDKKVPVSSVEPIKDVYEEFKKAIAHGDISYIKYGEISEKGQKWIENTVKNEYNNENIKEDYKLFLETTFDFLK